MNESIFSLSYDHLFSISDGSPSSPPIARIIRDFWCLFGDQTLKQLFTEVRELRLAVPRATVSNTLTSLTK
ncbi:MAG: hypothetical protein QOH71_816 [Blastocatellia bacterium]|nr:hypothetical protein [Blastocatellia bacterium]